MFEYVTKAFPIDNFTSHIKQFWPHPSSDIFLPHPIFLQQKELDEWSISACEIANLLSVPKVHSIGLTELNESLLSKIPECFSVDFAIIENDNKLSVRLIEAQGFPSVMSAMLDLECLFQPNAKLGSRGIETRRQIMTQAITNNLVPEHVIMLDDNVSYQTTGMDFMSSMVFSSPRCITSLYQYQEKWMHWRDAGAYDVKRIYHRSIFHTLNKEKQQKMLALLGQQKITHYNHPAWYYKIDKTSLGKIVHWSIPNTHSIDDAKYFDLQNMVLKYPNGFAGNEIFISPSNAQVNQAPVGSILQDLINYSAFYPSSSGDKKLCVELRFMLINTSSGYIPVTTLAKATYDGNLMRYRKNKQLGEGFTVAIGLDE